jgi:drug/metabolite transporter (DMT)-like permease
MSFFKSGGMIAFYSSIAIGLAYVLTEIASKEIGWIKMLVYLQLMGAIFLAGIALFRGKKLEIKKAIENKKYILETAVFRNILGQALFFVGFSMTISMKAVFLTRFEPIFVAIMGVLLLKEKIRKRGMTAIILLVVGSIVLSTGGELVGFSESSIGDLLVVAAMLSFAYSYIATRKIKNVNSVTVAFVTSIIGGLAGFVLLLLSGQSLWIDSLYHWQVLIAYAFLFNGLAIYWYYAALRRTKAWVVASILSFSSVIGAVVAWYFMGQELTPVQWVGALIVLGASLFVTYESLEGKK